MAKTNESDAVAADSTTTEPVAAPAPTPAAEPVAARAPRTGLRIAGIAAGGVLAGALLFGGGIAVGHALPDGHGGPGFMTAQLLPPGAEQGFDRGGMPGMPGPDREQHPPRPDDGARPGQN